MKHLNVAPVRLWVTVQGGGHRPTEGQGAPGACAPGTPQAAAQGWDTACKPHGHPDGLDTGHQAALSGGVESGAETRGQLPPSGRAWLRVDGDVGARGCGGRLTASPDPSAEWPPPDSWRVGLVLGGKQLSVSGVTPKLATAFNGWGEHTGQLAHRSLNP